MKCGVNIANRLCYLPLRDAVLCADCEFISSDRGEACAVCGGTNLIRVSEALGQAMPGGQDAQADFGFMMLSLGCESSPESGNTAQRRKEKHV